MYRTKSRASTAGFRGMSRWATKGTPLSWSANWSGKVVLVQRVCKRGYCSTSLDKANKKARPSLLCLSKKSTSSIRMSRCWCWGRVWKPKSRTLVRRLAAGSAMKLFLLRLGRVTPSALNWVTRWRSSTHIHGSWRRASCRASRRKQTNCCPILPCNIWPSTAVLPI